MPSKKQTKNTAVADKTTTAQPAVDLQPQQTPAQRGVAMILPREQEHSTALTRPAMNWTEEQLELMKRTVSQTPLTNDEFQTFVYVAKARNLDPLQKQIHAVKRKVWDDKEKEYVERMTIQTGIDGYRAIANRTGLYMPSEKEPRVEGIKDDGTIVRKQLRVTVFVNKWSERDHRWHELNATAYFAEFAQTYKKNNEVFYTSMWEKMPINQLTKCAEALALRKGWPEELGDIRTDEEMQQADSGVTILSPEHEANEKKEAARLDDKKKREAQLGTMTKSAEPNRGHGNEGFEKKKSEPTTLEGEVVEKEKTTEAAAKSDEPAKPRLDLNNLPADLKTGFARVVGFEARSKSVNDATTKKPKKVPYLVVTMAKPNDSTKTFEAFVWHNKLQGVLTQCLKRVVGVVYKQTVIPAKGEYPARDAFVIEAMFDREDKEGKSYPTDLDGGWIDPEMNRLIDEHLQNVAQSSSSQPQQ